MVLSKKETNELWEWTKAIGVAIVIALVIRAFVFAPIVVDGQSMMPTLENKDRLIVNKAVYYIKEPKRGDIIVFHSPENNDWIKRVIGEPGDEVEIRDGILHINGEEIDEYYLNGLITEDFDKVTVPENMIFVMGDNRYNSKDSRNPHVGPIPIDSVVGRAQVVFWPTTDIRIVR